MKMMINKGIIPINKPSGWTSFDVVNKIKHLLRQVYGKNMPKVGHLGTLDPMATGVLLVTIGSATKLFDLLQQKHKTYIAEFKFGEETDTLDSTGNILNQTINIPTLGDIESALPYFIGKISQLPPKYSAKSVNGKRAYELARNNIDFELKPKDVEVYSIDLISYEDGKLKLEIECGSGTYIRSLGRDIAYKTNSLANMTSLIRTEIDKFSVEDCIDIENLNTENLENFIIKVNNVLANDEIKLNETETKKLLNGQTLSCDYKDGIYKLNNEVDTIAIVKIKDFKAKMLVFLG